MLDSNFYLEVVYSGIVQSPTLLKEHIKTCELDAKDKNVASVMFYHKLIEAVKSIKLKFENAHYRDLDNHYKWVNIENSLPEDKRYQYPINDLPDINTRGLPLFFETRGKYRGELYFSQVASFAEALNQLVQELDNPKKQPIFKDIFNPNNNSFQVCIDLLEDLEITNNRVSRLKKGRAGKLTGVISAMKQTLNFFKQEYSNDELLKYFNTHLNTDYKTFGTRSKEYDQSIDDAKRFIKNCFIK